MVPASITVGVGHSRHNRPSHVQWIDVAGRVSAPALITRHHSGVLVGNGTLGCHHLLVLQELLLPLVAVIAVATVHALPVMLGTDGNHCALRVVTAVLLALVQILALRVANENDVALVYSRSVRAGVRPLLVAPSEASPTPVVDRVAASLAEVEE